MKIIPLGDRILIEPLSEEERGSKTASGIFIPDTAKERPEEGTVVAVGPGRMSKTGTLIPVQNIKTGDRVLFTKYGPNEIKVDGKEYLIAREDDILAVIG